MIVEIAFFYYFGYLKKLDVFLEIVIRTQANNQFLTNDSV